MKLGRKLIGFNNPTYFIADIASNHNGQYSRAERLIQLAAEAGADAVKFQNFKAETIISDYGFKELGKTSHQAEWKDNSVYEVYKYYETPVEWAPKLKKAADDVGVDYITTPYDISIIPYLDEFVCAWKIGSGDITYEPLIRAVKDCKKPVLVSTGASTGEDIGRALSWIHQGTLDFLGKVVLMQCNTNYTNDPNNIAYVNLKVLVDWWGGGILGFSDHTYGDIAVLGAVALGARVIEKHFTEDNDLMGPDHKFAMNPVTWQTMISRTRELETCLGDGVKRVEDNEKETVVSQRRAIRAKRDIAVGETLTPDDVECLRPCPETALAPYRLEALLAVPCKRAVVAGDYFRDTDVGVTE